MLDVIIYVMSTLLFCYIFIGLVFCILTLAVYKVDISLRVILRLIFLWAVIEFTED